MSYTVSPCFLVRETEVNAKKILQINDLSNRIEKLEKAHNKNSGISSIALIAGVVLAFLGQWLFVGIAALIFIIYGFSSYKLLDFIDNAKDEKRNLLAELED